LRVAVGVALALSLLAGPGARAEDAAPRVIKIVAKKFNFTPSEIHIKKGEHVVLELTSADRKHGFKVPELGIRVDVQPGTATRVDVTPQKVGKFAFACDIFCGDGHEDMNGTLIVDP
jgi:cytochrome c oxidase subunit II